MTLQETKAFMEEIKAFYPSFQYEDYLPKQWVTQLKDCGLLEAKKYFENHKIGSMKEKPPTLTYFVSCYNNSQKKKPGTYRCRYCCTGFENIDDMHKCQDLCRSKKYIQKIANILELDIAEIFGTTELNQELIDKYYKRFMYKAVLKQKETQALFGKELDGLMLYYRNVLKPALEMRQCN